MRLSNTLLSSLLLLVASLGCGDDDVVTDAAMDTSTTDAMADAGTDAEEDASVDAMADAGDADTSEPDMGMPALCPTDTVVLDAIDGAAALAVMNSDFTSSAVSLLAADGSVLAESWFDSGSAAPGLTAALGGDAVLASSHPAGTLGIIDRFGADVVTRFCISSGSLIGQLRVGADGFSSNPQDMIVDGDRGFISRYEQNPNAGAPAADQGSDLIGFNARTMERNGERVSLAEFGEVVTGLDGETEVDVTIIPRPTRIARVGEFLVVSLERLPADLFGSARGFGTGLVAIVSLSDLSVEGWELEGLANCGQVVPVAGADDEVLVACKGYSNIGFGDAAGERATAGVVRLQIDGAGDVTELSAWRASDTPETALAVNSVASLGGANFVGVANGEFGGAGDSLVAFVDGDIDVIAMSGSGFNFGVPVFQDDVLLVPDASAEAAHLVRLRLRDGEEVETLEPLEVTSALPPRAVSAL